ncbi:MAG: hypothetical protein QXX03_05685 [Nitrososphaerota archaeon]
MIRTSYYICLDLNFILETKPEKLSFPLLEVKEGYNFNLSLIDIKTTIFYDYFLGDLYFRLADKGDKIYPHVLIMPNKGPITLEEPLNFTNEVRLIIEPSMAAFRELTLPKYGELLKVLRGYPFLLSVRIEGVLYAL